MKEWNRRATQWLKFRGVEAAGWLLVLTGLAALIFPGPGLLLTAGGVALLALRYKWAKRLLRPIKRKAMGLARLSVKTWPRIILSTLFACLLLGIGTWWGIGTPVPTWWTIDSQWWLFGGWGTGSTLMGSGIIALGTLIYSFHHFRNEP